MGFNINSADNENQFYADCQYYDGILKEFYDDGLIMVCAAGNDNNEVDYPGCSPYTLTASSIDSQNEKSDFSCFGDSVDFALPGSMVGIPYYTGDSDYGWADGTSMSTPFLAAAVAEVLSENGTDTPREEWMDILKQNAVDLGEPGKDVYFGYGSIDFNSNMFNTPRIISLGMEETTWSTSGHAAVKAICGNNITSYAITQSSVEPTEWQNVLSPSTELDISLDVNNNGTYYVWVKDALGHVDGKTVEATFIDSSAPVINSISCTSRTSNSFTVQVSVEDNLSGVSKIDWYYKKSSDTNFIKYTETCDLDGVGMTGTHLKDHTFSDLNTYTDYIVYVEIFDMVGNSTRSNDLNVKTLKDERNIVVTNYTNGNASVTVEDETSSSNTTFASAENSLRVTCNEACVVLLKNSENEYEAIAASGIGTAYDFDLGSNQNNLEIVVALRGDVNLNGRVNLADAATIRKSKLSQANESYVELSVLQEKVADVDKNGAVELSDAAAIRNSRLSQSSANYQELSW